MLWIDWKLIANESASRAFQPPDLQASVPLSLCEKLEALPTHQLLPLFHSHVQKKFILFIDKVVISQRLDSKMSETFSNLNDSGISRQFSFTSA